jgi:hypothetical protein
LCLFEFRGILLIQKAKTDYLSWAAEENAFLRKRGLDKLSAENTVGLLIIGAELTPAEEKT